MATTEQRKTEVEAAAAEDGMTVREWIAAVADKALDDTDMQRLAQRAQKRHRERTDPLRFYDVPETLIPPRMNDGRRVPVWSTSGTTRRGIVKAHPDRLPAAWYTQAGGLRVAVKLVGVAEDVRALYADAGSVYYRPDEP